ncbi:hypothetical protein PF005_g10434 [Phytophthora fragariae]|uniref:PDZ domain-containing protein n=1 Tax=Phytophthora fragariae TaxID=53985 RepID=A0A6A3KYJ2_9STRA|nr:hypothetical protein PF003_g30157 [Phytophthora fragariae]KAE8937491.1 hypothetical protein PF009_g12609 [Phytophthora fragariae]KAE9010717.1 hypothetical protein PF011_g9701 [Phytophthora fragariae]KAE9112875.1 hypothetical protein PF007_g10942 [Phytophthora fragariae]KAE9144271.1 hypothetical protein PF006_g10775 [Phytophthora fragariae]
MASRRVFPLSVDASSSSSSVNRSQPPPPKSPSHRPPVGNGAVNELVRPPTGGSVGSVGFDRLMMMRQVNAAAAPSTASQAASGDEASAAVNHRQRMAAEQQRRLELALMAKEDYTGTREGQERLQRQEERSRMREEELLVLRLVQAEKEAARKLQREKELEEEKRVKDQYLAKIRAQREQQEREAKEKEAARKAEMEKRMKALKEAADAKARAEFAQRQHAIEEEARIVREKHLIEVENAQMQVEDVLNHVMQEMMIAERERQRQIAAEHEEWRLFQAREEDKQREATQLRRAAMAQQYEQDKQRRIQIHKLQRERAAQQNERKEVQNRQVMELKVRRDGVKAHAEVASPTAEKDNASLTDEAVLPSAAPPNTIDDGKEDVEMNVELSAPAENIIDPTSTVACEEDQGDPPGENSTASEGLKEEEDKTSVVETRASENLAGDTTPIADATISEAVENTMTNSRTTENLNDVGGELNTVKEPEGVILKELAVEHEKQQDAQPVWSMSAAREKGFVPFAQVLSVAKNSPAMEATLESGDLLVEFGGIVSSTPKCLISMAECVQTNVNKSIHVVLLRPAQAQETHFQELRVSLCPRKWKGKGLLGCQLSPFKWADEQVLPQSSEVEAQIASADATSSSDEGASALVVYDIAAGSAADQAGLVNGDILAGCEGMALILSVATISEVVNHIQASRAAGSPVHLDINRWIAEDQCYRSLRVTLSLTEDSGPLGFSLTSFAEYYNYYSSNSTTASECEECYYTSLTTALHAAALSGHVNCLEALLTSLQNGDEGGYTANDYLDWRDEDGRTPLFYACYAGQLDCVRYLVQTMLSTQHEQQPTIGTDLFGDTVLHAATTSGNIAVIAMLLEFGCVKVDDRNHTHLTCAHVAPNVETLTFLGEQSEADLLATDAEERMPLAYACLRNDVESIQYLCKKHPDFVDYADVHGNTPLHIAAWMGLQEAAEVLVCFLPSIALYITNENGQNAAELARSSGMEDVAAFLDSVIAAADSNVS